MNWDNARYLLAVARTGSLRAAAAAPGVDQATVTRRLRSLEQELNAPLFSRSPEGYRLPDIEQMEAAAAIERKSMGMNNAQF